MHWGCSASPILKGATSQDGIQQAGCLATPEAKKKEKRKKVGGSEKLKKAGGETDSTAKDLQRDVAGIQMG